MNTLQTIRKPSRSILLLEAAGFLIVALTIWTDELFDLPRSLFGAPPAAVNFHEALAESLAVLALGVLIILLSRHLLRRISQLESLLPICSFCKRIRKTGTDPEKQESWEQIERYINARTGAQFSHGLCPECLEKHYGKLLRGEEAP